MPIFSQTMSRNSFQFIQRYLHFIDNNAAGTNEDHLYKIRTILDIVINKFISNFIPDREISLDEGMLGWRGNLRFRVYKLRGLSPRANYTDRAAAAGRRS